MVLTVVNYYQSAFQEFGNISENAKAFKKRVCSFSDYFHYYYYCNDSLTMILKLNYLKKNQKHFNL